MSVYNLSNIAQNLPIAIKNALMHDDVKELRREVERAYPEKDEFDKNMDRLLFVACTMDPPHRLQPRLARLPAEYASLALEKGANPNGIPTMALESPLKLAAKKGSVGLIDLLVKRGANVDGDPEHSNTTPLYVALGNERNESIKCLLGHGANPNAGNVPAWFALFYGGDAWSIKCLDLMIEHGADINAKDKRGVNALHYWLDSTDDDNRQGGFHVHLINALVERGIDLQSKDENGMTVLDFCSHKKLKTAHNALLKHMANIAADALDQSTPSSRPAHRAQRL